MTTLLLILISVSLSAAAQIAFKFGVAVLPAQEPRNGQPWLAVVSGYLLNPGVIGGLVLYGIGTLLWLQVLARVPLSQAYPFVGLGFAMTAALGPLLFGETVTPMRITGIALVIFGIIVIARS